MNYFDIMHDDMKNGDGLRVTLFVAGCEHHCKGCHNPQTHDPNKGIKFDADALHEIDVELNKDYISGLTLTGGDPLHPYNIPEISGLVVYCKGRHPEKSIWLYTGYTYEELMEIEENKDDIQTILGMCDVLVDGRFDDRLKDEKYHWAGSTNQRVIDLNETNKLNKIVLY